MVKQTGQRICNGRQETAMDDLCKALETGTRNGMLDAFLAWIFIQSPRNPGFQQGSMAGKEHEIFCMNDIKS